MLGIDTVDAHASCHAEMDISGGIPLVGVHDTTSSWFDVGDFDSRRFVQHIHEGRYRATRDFHIDPAEREYVENGKPAEPSTADPLDDVSLLYYVRTLPLAEGDRYELHRYFQPAGNPVVIRVIRREEITVPAGRYRAILVEPEIATAGIFSRKGRAQVVESCSAPVGFDEMEPIRRSVRRARRIRREWRASEGSAYLVPLGRPSAAGPRAPCRDPALIGGRCHRADRSAG